MKNLKKLLSVMVVVIMIFTAILPASAASAHNYEAQANALHELGLYAGVDKTTFDPALSEKLTREQGITLLVRFMGAGAEAEALSDSMADAELIFFSDKGNISSWAKKSIAYALQKKWVYGNPDGTIQPQAALLGKQLATMYLSAMGYTVDSTIYQSAAYYIANMSTPAGGVKLAQASSWNDKVMTRDDTVGFAYSMLSVKTASSSAFKGKTLAAVLIDRKVATIDQITKAGAYEQDLYDAALAAIEIYEKVNVTKLTTVDACKATETTQKAASDAIAKITSASIKADFESRVTAKKSAIDTIKSSLEKIPPDNQAELVAAAEKAVAAYETTKDYANSEALKLAAVAASAKVKDEVKSKGFMDRTTARSTDITAIVAATSAVDAYINAPYSKMNELTVAENLEKTASEKVALIKDKAVNADLAKKVTDRKALVDAKRAEITSSSVAVTANNLKNITLTFTKPMNITTSELSNIKLFDSNNNSIAFGTSSSTDDKTTGYYLSEDKKILTLVYSNPGTINQSTNLRIVINNLKDTNGTPMSYDKVVSIIDQTNAKIEVKTVDAYSLKVAATEPLNLNIANGSSFLADGTTNKPLIKIDGYAVYVKKVTNNIATGTIDFEFYSALTNGSHTLDLSGFRDYAGFIANSITGFTVSTTRDITPPSIVSASISGLNKVIIKFSEKIADNTVLYPNSSPVFTVKQIGDTSARTILAPEYKDDTVTLTLSPGSVFNYAAVLGVTITVTGVTDSNGNKIGTPALSYTAKAEDNTVIPAVVGQPVVEKDTVRNVDNVIKIVFNEKVDITTIKFFDKDKKEIPSDKYILEDYDTANPDQMTFRWLHKEFTGITKTTTAADFKFTIMGAKDLSIRQNVMAEATFTVVTRDNTPPVLWYAARTSGGTGNDYVIKLYFSEPIDEAYAKTISNYLVGYNPSGSSPVLNVSLSSITGFTNDNITLFTNSGLKLYGVQITIPRGNIADILWSNNPRTYVGVLAKDTAGNTMSVTAAGGIQNAIAIQDPAAHTSGFTNEAIKAETSSIDSIKIKADYTTSTTSKYYFSSADPSSFKIIDAATGDALNIGIVGAIISADYSTVELKLTKQLNTNGTYTDTTRSVTYNLAVATTGLNALTKNQYAIPLNVGYHAVLTDVSPKGTAAGTALADVKVADKIAPVVTGVNKNISGIVFNATTGLAETDKMAAGSNIEVVFSEEIQSVTGIPTDIANVFTVTLGSATIRPYIDFTTSINGNKVILTFTADGLKAKDNKIARDLSNVNITFNTANNYMIVDKAAAATKDCNKAKLQ